MGFDAMVNDRRRAAVEANDREVRARAQAIAVATMPLKPHADAVAAALRELEGFRCFQRTFGKGGWERTHLGEPPQVSLTSFEARAGRPSGTLSKGVVTLTLGSDGTVETAVGLAPAGGVTQGLQRFGPLVPADPEGAAAFVVGTLADFAAVQPEPIPMPPMLDEMDLDGFDGDPEGPDGDFEDGPEEAGVEAEAPDLRSRGGRCPRRARR